MATGTELGPRHTEDEPQTPPKPAFSESVAQLMEAVGKLLDAPETIVHGDMPRPEGLNARIEGVLGGIQTLAEILPLIEAALGIPDAKPENLEDRLEEVLEKIEDRQGDIEDARAQRDNPTPTVVTAIVRATVTAINPKPSTATLEIPQIVAINHELHRAGFEELDRSEV